MIKLYYSSVNKFCSLRYNVFFKDRTEGRKLIKFPTIVNKNVDANETN